MNQHKDFQTHSYFDKNVPEYSENRYIPLINFINSKNKKNASLIDVGCGTGNILKNIKHQTGINDLFGIDISDNYLSLTKKVVDCKTLNASILDHDMADKVGKKFDYVIVGAILHHLIGDTREESKELANKALKNTLDLLKNGGHLIIFEPIFSPKSSMDRVFNVKKWITKITSKRLSLFGYWNNIGEPVVSYYDKEILQDMMKLYTQQEPSFCDYNAHHVPFIMRMAGISDKGNLTIIYEK